MRALIAAQPPDARLMRGAHRADAMALTGVFPRSGEIVILRRRGGGFDVPERVRTRV